MCLAIPGKILRRWTEDDGAIVAEADFDGEMRRVKLNFLPDLQPGDHVIVHAGFALTKVAGQQVEEVMTSLDEAGILEDHRACL